MKYKIPRKRTILTILIILLLMTVGNLIYTMSLNHSYEIYYSKDMIENDISLKFNNENITFDKVIDYDNYYGIRVIGQKQGKSEVTLIDSITNEELETYVLGVDYFNNIYDTTSLNFTGYKGVMISSVIGLFLISVVLFFAFRSYVHHDLYRFHTVYLLGFSIYLFVSSIIFSYICFLCLTQPDLYDMVTLIGTFTEVSGYFLIVSIPFVLVFGLSIILSNILLMIREKRRTSQIFGILFAIGLISILGIGLYFTNLDYMGELEELRMFMTITNIYTTLYCFGVCMLVSVIITGLMAAKRVPHYNKDYIIILGNRITYTGRLLPLLRNKCDKAIEFYHKQYEETGKKAILIPSGGQRKHEPISEALAMKNYLVSQGIEESQIKLEDQSKTTKKSMIYSHKYIDDNDEVLFVTSSYHVFRAGVIAEEAGLKIEGLGSPTKWYFWPNAFIREFLGLLLHEWKREIILIILLSLFFFYIPYLVIV